ncbi:MAG: aminotransferase class V-fold PLP-dependent enzyme [Calditrichaeota bacterium]|nr:MAG: aminotransferase class V-fold PLP-dependent enzyme [Calditrichota bacterium]MBL1204665.1 aminotransferase class V-fold PLP-dependent enzyme [Calditrichota bacterium]NOG44493.1 aminotransferase class V-fold PLP-dependent enzyme [Calditrichota bacterium]
MSISNGVEWKKGICGICPAGCWIEAGMKDGKMVDIRADKSHQLGMICRRGEHAPEMIYSENRLKYPMKRIGPKGSTDPENFERISWDEAYGIIAKNLNKIKAESGPEAVSIYTGRGSFELSLCDMFQPKGVAVSSASNVLFPFGSPNTMGVGALCYVSFAMIAPHVTMGRMLVNMFTDMENAEMLVVWGANPATDSPPLDMGRLEAAAKRGCDIVVIDPRHTETATRTGAEWVSIRPGTDGALALSMIEVMIDEELYDEDFAENWTHGFEELRTYTQHFSPEVAEKITGVPADKIRDLSRRICKATGAAPVMYTGLEYSNSGIQAIRAVHSLFALAGHLDTPGGIGLAMNDTHFPINRSVNQENPNLDLAVAREKVPIYSDYRGESHASGLVDAVLNEDPYKIRGLIIHGASLLTSWPQTPVWRETLSKLDFQVCIDRQMTADAAYADVILPATTMFEIDSYMVYGPIFRLREKLVEPVGEARNDYLIMAQLAESLGYGHLYPQTENELLCQALKGSGYSIQDVKDAGGWVKNDTPMMEYKKWQKGSLRKDGKPGFETPSGKFEVFSTTLDDYGYEPLPKYTEPVEGPQAAPDIAKDYPLVFNSGARPHTDFRSQHHGIKGLNKDNPEPTVELNLEDAKDREIENGDLVEVSTPRGAVPFRARISDNIIKGAVECNMGGGTPVGPKAWQKWNVNELTDLSNFDEISGFPVYKSLLCDVAKIEKGSEEVKSRMQATDTVCGVQFTLGAKGNGKSKPEKKQRIYLDNNATTKVAEAVREAMQPYLDTIHGNPSSIHGAGRDAKEAVENARRSVAKLLNAKPRRIVFTASGSEADNMALKGIAFSYRHKGNHIITTKVEHPAILRSCEFLEKIGYSVTYLDVNEDGSVTPKDLEKAITKKTILVSMMMANNETGTILPIKDLAAVTHKYGAFFHTDAVQAVGKVKVDVEEMDVDLLSLSAHKFHGPKGMGALFIKKGIELEPLVHGGGQENGLRAGTENVSSIVGLGKACELAIVAIKKSGEMQKLRDKLQDGILKLIPEAKLNGSIESRLPNTLNMILPKLRGESLVVAMDQHGISFSSGSACKSGSPKPTHVLMAMGRSEEESHCAVRLSLNHDTSKADIDKVLLELKHVLEEIATTVRFLPCK